MQMNKLIRSLATILLSVPLFAANASYTTLVGTFLDAQGHPLSGHLVLTIPYAGLTTIEGSFLSPAPVAYNIYNGHIANPTSTLIPNADILPANTYYIASLYDSSYRLVETSNLYIPLGTTFDIGTAIQTSVTTTNISFPLYYQTLEGGGTPATQRPTLNLVGSTCTDNPGLNRTDCTSGAGGGGTVSSVTGTTNQIVVVNPTTTPVLSIANPFIAPGSISTASDGTHAGSIQFGGQSVLASLTANSVALGGPTTSSFTSYGLWFPSTPPAAGQFPSFGPPTSGWSPVNYSGGTAQLGDTLRYNVAGDNNWDAVNMSQPVSTFYPVFGGPPVVTGPMVTGNGVLGTQLDVNPTATSGVAKTFSSAAVGSLNTVIGIKTGENGNNSVFGMLAFYRWTLKLAIGQTTNARYWMGMGCYSNTGTANNTKLILNDLGYAADVPNKTTLGFRYSSGTDTHWQAVSANAGGSQTTTDTGVTPDTNPHVFEMATNITGTAVNFFIDGSLVATITTNLPVVANGTNSAGDMFWTGDNKNTANVVSATFYYMMTAHK